MLEGSPDLSVNTVAEIVRLALAPVFLLSGIGAFLNVLASRLSRIVDRSRDIEPMLLVSRGAEHDRWIAALKILDRRMSLITWATGLAVTSAILTCLVVVLLFAANLIRTRLGDRDCVAVHWIDVDHRRRVRRFPDRDDGRGPGSAGPLRAAPAYGGRSRLSLLSPPEPAFPEFSSPMNRAAASHVLDRVLVLEMVRVTEAAAIAASSWIGRGDNDAADAAAVEAMRAALNELPMDGTVVIGEGERDEAPMLYIGEKVGSEQDRGPKIDIALDPLEGTTLTAHAGPNALAVLAIAENGCLLNAPDVYMQKLAIGPGYPNGTIDLRKSPADNVRAIAKAKGVEPNEIIACVLERDRHDAIIAELRALGCGIKLIPDGDVAGVIATADPETGIDVYMGSGGAPEGVLAAAALRCVGGQMQGKLLFRNDDEIGRAHRWGIDDLDRIYTLEDMAKGDCIFAATGVTDGSLLKGVHKSAKCVTTESVVMRASTGTVRRVSTEYRDLKHRGL